MKTGCALMNSATAVPDESKPPVGRKPSFPNLFISEAYSFLHQPACGCLHFRRAESPAGLFYTVPATVTTVTPGSTVIVPSGARVNVAAGTVIAPEFVVNEPVTGS